MGQWRTTDDGSPIDPSGTLYNGTKVDGPVALRNMLASHPDVFAGVMTEKLLTYALGRGVEYYDMPAVRKIVHEAGAHDFRFSSLVLGTVESAPFEMKIKTAMPSPGQFPLKEIADMTFITKTASFAPDVVARLGYGRIASAAGFDAARPDSSGEDRGQSGNQAGTVLHPAWRGDGQLDPGGGRRRTSSSRGRSHPSSRSRTRWWW